MPDRTEIERRWRAVAEGTLSREEVHTWAEGLMLGDEAFGDAMVGQALQYLHGFSLADSSGELGVNESPETYLGALAAGTLDHGPPGRYLRTQADIEMELDRWLDRCAEFDRTHSR